MGFLKKSITWKFFIALIALTVITVDVWAYFYYTGKTSVPSYYLPIVAISFVVALVIIYWFEVARPLRIVLREMQALLAGMVYKRIYTERVDEVGIIANFFNKITKGLGDVSATIVDRERMLDELTIAAQLQKDILPKEEEGIPGLEIIIKIRPATEIGGDSFDFITVKNKTYIYLGDATGHGVAAGLIVTMVHAFIEVFADTCNSAFEVIHKVNKYIKQRMKKAMFMTMVMLSWDHKNKKLTYVGAGHEHILVYRSKTGFCEAILSGGIALGMVPDNSKIIKEKEIEISEGDYVILYSDGITEAKNDRGELYGLERLKNAIMEYAAKYATEGISYHVAKDVSNFMKGQIQSDDMTLMVIKRTDKVDTSAVRGKELNIEWKE